MGFELGNDGPLVIVVGYDGTAPSLRAGAYAAGLARRQGARLVVVHVTGTLAMAGFVPGAYGIVEETRNQIDADMRREVLEGAAYARVAVDFRSVRGDPFTELSRVADDVRADAVVVGASAGAGHRFVGSIAVRLVRSGRWPVTVVP